MPGTSPGMTKYPTVQPSSHRRTKLNVSRHPPCTRRHQEAPGLSRRRRRLALSPRRPLHRASRHFNPLLSRDSEARLKLDMDKVKAWLAKGAQPSDRVSRFLDAAGVVKRAARNNPEKAVPRKQRKAQAEAAGKTA